MTNEEAITYLMNNSCYECSYGCESVYKCRVTSCAFKNAIKESIAALEKQERYRWHDLRKNPEDLPKDHCNILAKTRNEVFIAYHDKKYKMWVEPFWVHSDDYVIAWKEIEPFEGECE